MTLNDWLANDWLVVHPPSRLGIRELLAVADRDLADADVRALSIEGRFQMAYGAALTAALAALTASGFRPARESHHHRVIQSLSLTIGADAATVDTFDAFRKKRNASGYERINVVTEHECMEMIALALNLRRDVEAWLRKNHPALL